MKNTRTEENYLKALFHLCGHSNTVMVKELSDYMDVKMPSVNNMMKKFAEKKWVVYESYKPLIITPKGLKEAALIVRKHRLTEMFLVEKMDIGWENVHEIAEQLEHIHSPLFFDKMDEILNFPKIDPHGEPIPDKNGEIIAQNLIKLSDCQANDKVIFKSVTSYDDTFLNYLNDRNLSLNDTFIVSKIEDFDHSMVILLNDQEIILSHNACEKILVKK
ncbi:MAG: iron (metal) dependent repressor, dtxr family protein [Flavobacteriales bacterium]|nr:MAG: iron (metal) dependent repressor, dtxr family protein [Flavobacteriales bacterium]